MAASLKPYNWLAIVIRSLIYHSASSYPVPTDHFIIMVHSWQHLYVGCTYKNHSRNQQMISESSWNLLGCAVCTKTLYTDRWFQVVPGSKEVWRCWSGDPGQDLAWPYNSENNNIFWEHCLALANTLPSNTLSHPILDQAGP